MLCFQAVRCRFIDENSIFSYRRENNTDKACTKLHPKMSAFNLIHQ